MKTNNRELVGSVAIQQALRFHFMLTYKEIAIIMKISTRTVWQNTKICMGGTLSWNERTKQDLAIVEAEKKMKEIRYNNMDN